MGDDSMKPRANTVPSPARGGIFHLYGPTVVTGLFSLIAIPVTYLLTDASAQKAQAAQAVQIARLETRAEMFHGELETAKAGIETAKESATKSAEEARQSARDAEAVFRDVGTSLRKAADQCPDQKEQILQSARSSAETASRSGSVGVVALYTSFLNAMSPAAGIGGKNHAIMGLSNSVTSRAKPTARPSPAPAVGVPRKQDIADELKGLSIDPGVPREQDIADELKGLSIDP